MVLANGMPEIEKIMKHNYGRDGYHRLISRLSGHKIKTTADIRKLSCFPNELRKSDLRRLDDLSEIVKYLEEHNG
jgi:hypothetical protein